MTSIVKAETPSPANVRETRVTEATRVPMSLPELKLYVPDIPGYHLHWFRGARTARAMQAGYEFVDPLEVTLVNTGLADDASKSGNSDLGSRVSVVAGDADPANGGVERLYLMKIRQEWHEQDMAALEAKNEQIAAAIRGSADATPNPHGNEQRYVPSRGKQSTIFTPKQRRS